MVGRIRSVKFNFIMNAVLTISRFVFPLITFPYISRVLGAEGTGRVAFVSSVVGYFIMVASLGIPTYGIRACAKVRDSRQELSKTVQELLFINIVVSIVVLAVYFVSVFSIERLYAEKTLFLINTIYIIMYICGVNWLYSALEQYKYITIRSLFFKILSIVLMFILIHKQNDYIIYGCLMIFAEVGSYLFNIINLRKYVDLKPSRKYHYEIKKHIKPILIFFSQSMAVTIYTNIDTVMLGFMKGNVEVGLYNVAVKFKSVIVSLVTSLGSVLLPRLSYYIEKGYKEKFYDMLNKSFNTTLILSLPLSLFFIIFAKSLIVFVAGEEFIGAVNATQVILLTIPLIGLSNLLGVQVAVPFNKEKYMVIATCIGAIVDVVINYICIPMWGNLGAAIGTLVTELSVLVILIILLKEYCVTMIQVVEVCKIGCGTLCSCVVGYGLNIYISKKGMEIWLGLMIETIVFFAVYFVVLLLTREKMVLFYLQQFVKKLKKNN